MRQMGCMKKVPHSHKYWISVISSSGKKAMIKRLCICRILFVAQINAPRGTFICVPNILLQMLE
jgi:hypothetical protein